MLKKLFAVEKELIFNGFDSLPFNRNLFYFEKSFGNVLWAWCIVLYSDRYYPFLYPTIFYL